MKEILRPYLLSPNDKLVRLGPPHDGGYVLPQSILDQCDSLITYGVGDNYEFEKAFVAYRDGNEVSMYDHTVANPTGEGDARIWFFDKKCTPTELFNKSFSNFDILKLDIEGDEYECLNWDIVKQWTCLPGCLIVEFHNVIDHLGWITEFVRRIGLFIVHVHGNNHGETFTYEGWTCPNTLEITFVKQAPLLGRFHGKLPLPGIDFPNAPGKPDFELDFS